MCSAQKAIESTYFPASDALLLRAFHTDMITSGIYSPIRSVASTSNILSADSISVSEKNIIDSKLKKKEDAAIANNVKTAEELSNVMVNGAKVSDIINDKVAAIGEKIRERDPRCLLILLEARRIDVGNPVQVLFETPRVVCCLPEHVRQVDVI